MSQGSGGGQVVLDLHIVLPLVDSQKADHDARNGAGVEKYVTQLDNQVRAAATDAVEQQGCGKIGFQLVDDIAHERRWLTEAGERDVAANHQGRMEVEPQILVLETVAAFLEDNPNDSQHDGGEEENWCEHHHEDVLAPWAALPGCLGVVIVSSEMDLSN